MWLLAPGEKRLILIDKEFEIRIRCFSCLSPLSAQSPVSADLVRRRDDVLCRGSLLRGGRLKDEGDERWRFTVWKRRQRVGIRLTGRRRLVCVYTVRQAFSSWSEPAVKFGILVAAVAGICRMPELKQQLFQMATLSQV